MNEEIPIYLFTGFMDSGKTTLILDTLSGEQFNDGSKTLVIVCEDGDTEYDEEKLKKINASFEMINDVSELTKERFEELNLRYLPDRVFIEYNGTWELAPLLDVEEPEGWVIIQTLTTVDATTFQMYLQNMRSMMLEQFFMSDVVIFNRCDDSTQKAAFRRAVKAKNRKAQVVFEREFGVMDPNDDMELPYDMNSPHLDITDADYGIWFLDIMDNYKNYEGKTVSFLACVYNPPGRFKSDTFVPGRHAMTCCVEDIQFIGLKCKYKGAGELAHKSWINITAEVKVEFAFEYKGKGPVLYATEVTAAEKPDDELVYFN